MGICPDYISMDIKLGRFSILGIITGLLLGTVKLPLLTPFFASVLSHSATRLTKMVTSALELAPIFNVKIILVFCGAMINALLPAVFITLFIYIVHTIASSKDSAYLAIPLVVISFLLLPFWVAVASACIIIVYTAFVIVAPNTLVVFVGRVIATVLATNYVFLLLKKKYTPLLDSARELAEASKFNEATALSALTVIGIVSLVATIFTAVRTRHLRSEDN